jgi:hypothetical protein
MQLVSEMGRLFQASLDINKVLYTVLTCITAGPALGFNRAFLLLLNEDSDTLKGAMALGQSSAEEAARIWRDLGQRQLSLQEILADETAFDPAHPRLAAANLAWINLQHPCLEFATGVHERRTMRVRRDELIGPVSRRRAATPRTRRFSTCSPRRKCVAPWLQDRIVGVVLADNLYRQRPSKTTTCACWKPWRNRPASPSTTPSPIRLQKRRRNWYRRTPGRR